MKREAVGNSKMKRLCRVLGIRQYAAIGLLESLWHLTAKEAPQGDIGKLSDEDIALTLDYEGEAGALIGALVECRWLDLSTRCRLVVHDWHEHADQAIKRKMLMRGMPFLSMPELGAKVRADGVAPHLDFEEEPCCQQNETVRTDLLFMNSTPEPEPEPEPVPTSAPRSVERNAVAAIGKLPCVDGSLWEYGEQDIAGWAEAYPAVSILDELPRAREWLIANPKNKKTQSGMRRFITNWLSRAQDRAPRGGNHGSSRSEDISPATQRVRNGVNAFQAAGERARAADASIHTARTASDWKRQLWSTTLCHTREIQHCSAILQIARVYAKGAMTERLCSRMEALAASLLNERRGG